MSFPMKDAIIYMYIVLASRAYSYHITGKNKSCFLSIHVRTCIARKVAMETPAQA